MDVTYNKMDLKYILKYSGDLPLKYHRLQALYIVELSKTAQLNVAPLPAAHASKTSESNTKPMEDESVLVKSNDTGKRKAPAPLLAGGGEKKELQKPRKLMQKMT
jgi:hypothetical protein